MDLQFLIFLFPAGVVMCFRELRDEHLFVIIYAVMASYFAGVMVRLMLTLTPVVCVASAVAPSSLLDAFGPTEADVAEEQVPASTDTMTSSAQALTTPAPLKPRSQSPPPSIRWIPGHTLHTLRPR